jgi:hypothetical protein
MVAVYAPYNPEQDERQRSFWDQIATLCNEAPNGWSVVGDFNTTLSVWEQSSGRTNIPPSQPYYLRFLNNTSGLDLWEESNDH